MNRVLTAARTQLVTWPSAIGWPWGILALGFAINIAIFSLIGDAIPPEGNVTGGLSAIHVVLLIVHVQTVTQVYRFALGQGGTRREFYAGSTLVIAGQSVVFGIALYLLGVVERGTGGWGLDLSFFAVSFLPQGNPATQILGYTVPFLALSFVGVVGGAIFQRWGTTGMFTATLGGLALFGGLAVLATWQRWWPAVGRFLEAQSSFVLLAGYPLGLAVLLAGAGYLGLRRRPRAQPHPGRAVRPDQRVHRAGAVPAPTRPSVARRRRRQNSYGSRGAATTSTAVTVIAGT